MRHIKEKWKQTNGKYKCPTCRREYPKMGIGTHIWRRHTEEGKNSNCGWPKGESSWSKGLTKETDKRVLKNAIAISKALIGKPGHIQTKTTREKISKGILKYYKKNAAVRYGFL